MLMILALVGAMVAIADDTGIADTAVETTPSVIELPLECDHTKQFCAWSTTEEPVKLYWATIVPGAVDGRTFEIELPAGHSVYRHAVGTLCVEQKAWEDGEVELYGPIVALDQDFGLKKTGKLCCVYNLGTHEVAQQLVDLHR
ncbi:MAG: hypothetical protein ABH846_00170 [Patescibacteria group bacterium]